MKELFKIDQTYHSNGSVIFKWQPGGNFLATAGANGLVHIFDRHGKQLDEVSLRSSQPVLDLCWDYVGESLAVLQQGNGEVPIWDSTSRNVTMLDTKLKNPTFIKWSRRGPQLAVGSEKGNLLIYSKNNRKLIPVAGKHSNKRITCGAWSNSNQLALGGEDKTMTLSNAEGDTVGQTELAHEPLDIQFAGTHCSSKTRRSSNAGGKSGGSSGIGDLNSVISMNLGGKRIQLYNQENPDDPVELAFKPSYGSIVTYKWFGDGQIMIGFSNGYFAAISTNESELGEELFGAKMHKGGLEDVAYCPALQRAATCGERTVRVIDVLTWKEIKSDGITLDRERGMIEMLEWTKDGQILTLSTSSGVVRNYLAQMPTVHDAWGSRLAYLSSLREISVVDTLNGDDDKMQVIPVNVEPTFVALGPKHVAVGMNIRIWLYRYGDREEQSRQSRNPPLVEPERQFPGNISAIRLNAKYVAVLCEGRVHLSVIEPKRGTTEQDTKIFNVDGGGQITCMALTEDMLIYGFVSGGARGGGVKFFSLADWLPLEGIEHRHETSITSIVPSPSGTRMIFIDVSGRGWLYNPADTSTLEIPNFKDERGLTSSGQPIKCALWDPVGDQDGKSRSLSGTQSQCFVTVEGGQFWTYVYSQLHFEGPTITRVGRVEINPDSGDMIQEALSTDVPHGSSPAVVRNGRVTCQHQSGALDTIVLNTHSNIRVSGGRGGARNIERLTECFKQRLCMLRLRDAWEIALQLNNRSLWLALSGKSMEHLDIGLAVQVYRDIGDAGMVQALERIKRIEDRQLLSGHVHLLFSQFEEAQERFLASSRPETALEMRRDLLNWDHALKLAGSIAPDQVPTISYEYGQQLEFKGEYALALKMYGSACTEIQTTLTELELGVDNGSSSNKSLGGGSSKLADLMMQQYGSKSSYDYEDAVSELKNKLKQCTAGLTRMTIRQGDLRRGILMANESNDKALCRECGSVLESMKQYGDAARMYEKGGSLEKAASIYIQTKDFDSAKPLMSMIKTAKLHSQYAKAKEAVRDFRAAVSAYERARDMDSVVRLYIDQLNEPELAFAIVRSTASSNAAQMVARYCTSKANWQGAIEFLLMAQRSEEAFQLAKEHDEMGVYATALGDEGSTTEYSAIARFYESKNEQGRAGQFYAKCGQYMKALNLYLDCGEREMDRAIDVVGKARSDMLTHTLIDYLMGERDGEPKDPNHIYRLYVALGNYERASATAVLISKQERELGNYKISHYQLYTTMSEMRNQGVRVPSELRNAFLLLHSYVLVKKLVKMGKHVNAAHMLGRVVESLSEFPKHTVMILTTAVIESYRSGMKKKAFEYASTLMRQEYRGDIPEKYKKKIESIVRKHKSTIEDPEEQATFSPYDSTVRVPVTELMCPTTRQEIPFCICTGYHVVADDMCICPNSKMPAIYSEYVSWIESNGTDPITDKPVNLSDVRRLSDPTDFLDSYNKIEEEQEEEGKKDSEK